MYIYIYTYIGEQQKDVGEGGDIVCNCVGLVGSSTSFCSVVLANSPLCCNCPKGAITVIYTKVGKTTNWKNDTNWSLTRIVEPGLGSNPLVCVQELGG